MQLDRIQLQAHFGGPWPFGDDADPTLKQLGDVRDKAMQIATEFRAEQEKLRQSGALTVTGLDQRLNEFAHSTLNRLVGQAERVFDRARADQSKLQAELARRMKAPTNDAAYTASMLFVLQHLFELPDPERVAVLREAAAHGETLVLDAGLNAPSFIQRKLALPVLLNELRELRAEASEPDRVRFLRELNTALQLAESAVRAARKIIIETPGLSDASKASIYDIALPTMAQAA